MYNLPSSIKKIIFNKESKYDKKLNCLPYGLDIFQLSDKYNFQIQNIPKGLKKVICSKNYPFSDNFNDFSGLEVETY